ncbi:hypothetical protein [Enorma sp.]|uniref:hypothetical protein n=1 Tax=Enorma sp. TaxID=1920692 RepID=UPI0025C1FB5B|nr:hypothetical protein [Enorma sp.]
MARKQLFVPTGLGIRHKNVQWFAFAMFPCPHASKLVVIELIDIGHTALERLALLNAANRIPRQPTIRSPRRSYCPQRRDM